MHSSKAPASKEFPISANDQYKKPVKATAKGGGARCTAPAPARASDCRRATFSFLLQLAQHDVDNRLHQQGLGAGRDYGSGFCATAHN